MSDKKKVTALSSGQTLDGPRVLRIPRVRLQDIIQKVSTWNVNGLCSPGKLHNLIKEMQRLQVNVMGISEMRWSGSGIFLKGNYTVYYSCSDIADNYHRHGVALVLENRIVPSVIDFIPVSNRVMIVRLAGQPININLIQVYAPTAEKAESEALQFYSEINQALKLTKKNDINLIMGDFNAKVGRGRCGNVVGDFGLGSKNERGDMLIEFCEEKDFIVSNTWFQLPPRRLYTWRAPGDRPNHIIRNQIDYILINKRFRNCIKRVAAYPGADIGSDHNPLIANIKLRLSKIKKTANNKSMDTRELMRDEHLKATYSRHINENLRKIEQGHQDIEGTCEKIKTAINEANAEVANKIKRTNKNEWMTNEILDLMEQRRLYKIQQNQQKYKETQQIIRTKIKVAKENWIKDRCEELELLQMRGDSFGLHKKVKEISHVHKKYQTTRLKNDQNDFINTQEELAKTWRDYASSLFSDDRPEHPSISIPTENLSGPPIIRSEVEHAIKVAKLSKATGPDDIPTEAIKLLEDDNIDTLVNLFNEIYSTGHIPNDWLYSTFIMIPKTSKAVKCKDHRLISLMSHMLKLFLRILHTRMFRKLEELSGVTQFGFKNGMGTREAVFCLNTLIQNCIDQRKDVYITFIDYEKAFDTVKHDIMIKTLQSANIDSRDIRIIQNLYWNQKARVRLNQSTNTEDFEVLRGVRQGCILSPMLFNLYVENVFAEALEGYDYGIKVNGYPLNNIRYADDTAILTDNEHEMQLLIDRINNVGKSYGLKINATKTKCMAISRNAILSAQLHIDNTPIEQVKTFKYLGTIINDQWDPQQEIKCRIGNARQAFIKFKPMLCNRNLSFDLRYRMVKCYVWSILLYGMETWTLKVSSINKLEAFEMWTLRRMLSISWTDKVRNEDVLRRAGTERELFNLIKVRKVGYLGHVLRGERYTIPQLIIQGKIEGKRGIGRKQMSWLRNIKHWTGINNTGELCHAAKNRCLTIR